MIQPDSETALYLSLSAKPGTFGVRFHNFLFKKLAINAFYLSRAVSDISAAVTGLKGLNVRGCAVSMPFKGEAMKLMDSLDGSARAVGALNTILNHNGKLTGFNTDTWAVESVIQQENLPSSAPVLILGAGGMARAVIAAFQKAGYTDLEVMNRGEQKGKDLERHFGVTVRPWSAAPGRKALIVNATALGFKFSGATLPPELEFVPKSAGAVWDMVGDPSPTTLIRIAAEMKIPHVPGSLITKLQAAAQFKLYTGVTPPAELVEDAFRFATGLDS